MDVECFMTSIVRVEMILGRCGEIDDLAGKLRRGGVGLIRYSTEAALRGVKGAVTEVLVKLSGVSDERLRNGLRTMWLGVSGEGGAVDWLRDVGQGSRGPDGVLVDGARAAALVSLVRLASKACRETRAMIEAQLELVEQTQNE